MAIKAIFDAIKEEFLGYRTDEPNVVFGAEKVRQQDTPPRIVVEMTGDTFQSARGRGGDTVGNPAPICTRVSGVRVHFWGKDRATGADDFGAAESLFGDWVAATHKVLSHGGYSLGKGEWMTVEGATSNYGVVYVCEMSWLIPVTKRTVGTAVITSMPQTEELDR